MYRKLLNGEKWPGSALPEQDGFPLTHDILERLDVLHMPEPIHADTARDDGGVQLGIGIDTYNSTNKNIIRGEPDEFGDRGSEILRWCEID
jgi:hypothetical protein